jgi:hypothetical protein
MIATGTMEDFAWSPLFAGIPTVAQTSRMAVLPHRDPLPCPGRSRLVEDLVATTWKLVETRPDGLILRDGNGDRWSEETLWIAGSTPGRSYAVRHAGREFEFARVRATQNPYATNRDRAKVRRHSEAA